jgi:DNA-binding transcriptional ArsR family regulator
LILVNEEFQAASFLAKILSDENRLKIHLCISRGKKAVGSIVEEPNLSQPIFSYHLKELKRSLLGKIERNGPIIYYEVPNPRILGAIGSLNSIAKICWQYGQALQTAGGYWFPMNEIARILNTMDQEDAATQTTLV